ncbi:hypothetical protein EVAR_14020_1 [Eumeta japonica]|uniref:Uncharacterized protein n=1 Tax=Eumeta variegata TaxID=151549 RepID=A0A4C1X8W5_EUMVA|nr:hypothetical protein EVAR_14020_1 [Eumeta japonica]
MYARIILTRETAVGRTELERRWLCSGTSSGLPQRRIQARDLDGRQSAQREVVPRAARQYNVGCDKHTLECCDQRFVLTGNTYYRP